MHFLLINNKILFKADLTGVVFLTNYVIWLIKIMTNLEDHFQTFVPQYFIFHQLFVNR
jgi:hypothetical protein